MIKLEEMDWKNAANIAKDSIRQGLMMQIQGEILLNKANEELEIIYNSLSEDEKKKRKV